MSEETFVAAAPPTPPRAPSDWGKVVRSNVYSNLQRLGLWTGKNTLIPVKASPANYFSSVQAGSLGMGTRPNDIYVLVHGWAPGYRAVANKYNNVIQWWSGYAIDDNKRWAADWAWSPVGPPTAPTLQVNPTGVLQQIYNYNPNAQILAYSWIDDSATDSGDINTKQVYESAAYTHMNGIRLANALVQAITPSFFQNHGVLHIIGHSHGSKVATVATMTLQNMGITPNRLTILDSPETTSTLDSNSANLLPFYLDQMTVQNQNNDCAAGTYVDNYASYFGMNYLWAEPKSQVENVVEVSLNPYPLYGTFDPGDSHSYAAAWYGAAYSESQKQGQPSVGLNWPPVPSTFKPAMNQTWPGSGYGQYNQWLLASGSSQIGNYVYSTHGMYVDEKWKTGKVIVIPCDAVVMAPMSNGTYSVFQGNFPANNTDQYGFGFDLIWDDPQPGDYFVAAIKGEYDYTLFVLDGRSAPRGKTSVVFTADIETPTGDVYFYFLGTPAGNNQIRVAQFRYLQVSSPSASVAVVETTEATETAVN